MTDETPVKRGPGRPRKHPIGPQVTTELPAVVSGFDRIPADKVTSAGVADVYEDPFPDVKRATQEAESVAPAEVDDAGDPEPSLVDVERMLEERDFSGKPDAPLGAAPPIPEPPAAPEIPAGELHALDLAPLNSKIVVTEDGALLAGSNGVSLLPKHDPASKLPRGARIQKLGTDRFVAVQLSATVTVADLETTTAAEAIRRFLPHFHPGGFPRP